MSYRTQDQVAQEFIAEGRRRNITERGIVICIATGLVESNLTVYANAKVPDSLALPHDAVGSDSYSVGPLQQQVVWGNGGWWWGDAATCMDPTKSAGLFYDRLVKFNYAAATTDAAAGAIAQDIQDSQFPDRYAARMAEAQGYYSRLSGNAPVPQPTEPAWFTEHNIIDGSGSQDRNGRKPRLFILHTEEGNMTGQALDDWMDNNSVSYHYIVGNDGVAWDLVDTDLASWSVLDANNYTINLVFAPSFAAWTRNEWLNNMGTGIQIAAYLCAQDCHKYGIPPVVRVGNSASGYPSLATNDGVTDHYGITVGLGIGTHTDVGKFFPWDQFQTYLTQFFNNGIEEDDMFTDDDRALLKRVHFELTNPWNSASMYAAKDETPNPGNTLVGVGLSIDSMTHAKVVEDQALKGDADSIMRILRTAAGEGLYGDDPRVVKRATAAAEEIPKDILQAYEDAQK